MFIQNTFITLLVGWSYFFHVGAFTVLRNPAHTNARVVTFGVVLGEQNQPRLSRESIGSSFGRKLSLSSSASDDLELKRVSSALENVPIPFIDPSSNSFIECYADSVVTIEGVTYTVAVPCDYSVALCYFDSEDQLIPVELNDPLMDDIYPMAESIVAEEFGEELVLQRTPQTLTLVGELEDDEDEDEDDEESDDDDEDEEVEVLLSFDHRGQEISLVRLLDPILLVGKENPADEVDSEEEGGTRLLLTPEESDAVMPLLEDLFLKFHESANSKMP